MSRNIFDADLKKTSALPAAAAANYTASIDLGSEDDAVLEEIEVEVVLPDVPALIDDKDITLTLKDSADDSSFSAIVGLDPIVVTGVDTPGADGVTRKFRLPSSTRQYLRLDASVESGGGDNTGVDYYFRILT
jgi:hypothetical protein